MDEVDALVDALRAIGSPVFQARRPGLSRRDLEEQAVRYLPEPWVSYIDDEVASWFSWQNGVDRTVLTRGGESWLGCSVITPDEFAIAGLDEMLQVGWEIAGEFTVADVGIAFPLGWVEEGSGNLFLNKEDPDSEWRVWNHRLDSGLLPFETGSGFAAGAPTFREWLTALTRAISTGGLILGRRGNITVPGKGGRRARQRYYPWTEE